MAKMKMLLRSAAVGLTLTLAPYAAHAQASVQVVMSGLDNPRGLTVGPDGAVYVAESGKGGPGGSIVSSDGSTISYGATSVVDRYLNGAQQRVVTSLPSLADQGGATPGGSATGLSDLAFDGSGNLYGVVGLGAPPSARGSLGTSGANFAQLVRLDPTANTWQTVADLGAYEDQNNPDGTTKDTNPYGLTALPGGGLAVTDAGGNDLLRVSSAGVISTVTTFAASTNPLFPTLGGPTYQAVPTGVTVGPDGALYVGQLTGFPYPGGAANVFRVDPTTGSTTVAYTGFTNISDLTFGTDGSLYVTEYSAAGLASPAGPGAGALIRVDKTGARTTLLSSDLLFPSSVVQGADGALYVSNRGVVAGGGQVLRVTVAAVPEPGALWLLVLGLPIITIAAHRRRAA